MSAKKDSAVAPVVVSTSIAQPNSVATVAPEVVPFVEVHRDVDLHMRDVSESPSLLPAESPHPFPNCLLAHRLGWFPLSHPQVPLLLRVFDLVCKKVVEVYLPAQQNFVECEFCTKHFFVINTICSNPEALVRVKLNGFRFHTSLLHSLPVLFLKFSCIVQI